MQNRMPSEGRISDNEYFLALSMSFSVSVCTKTVFVVCLKFKFNSSVLPVFYVANLTGVRSPGLQYQVYHCLAV